MYSFSEPFPLKPSNGSTLLAGTTYFLERNAAQTVPIGQSFISWDTSTSDETYTGYDGDLPASTLTLPPGIYQVDLEADIGQPAGDRLLYLRMFVAGGSTPQNTVSGGMTLIPATAGLGGFVTASGILIVTQDTPDISTVIGVRPADTAEASPPSLDITYAYAIVRKLS